MDTSRIADVIEIEQLLARYAVGMTKSDVDAVAAVFAPDGTYSAFGEKYSVGDFPELVAAAPTGAFTVSTPAIVFEGEDTARGEQVLSFVAQHDHSMRIGWYTDSYTRTPDGWRLQARAMTFLRRSGARDSGRAHDPLRPAPQQKPAS